jgi:hypothetical protein
MKILKIVEQILLFPVRFIKGRLKTDQEIEKIEKGQGGIIDENGKKVAVYKTEDGEAIKLSPKCTHMGCILHWDKEQKRWHCKCHNSAFSPKGEVLFGPAGRDLKNLSLEEKAIEGHAVKILMTQFVTHNVKRFVVEKPRDYSFVPGQATSVSINKEEWIKEERPFTFTSLNDDEVLEFTIKEYPEHKGVTQKLHSLKPGDQLIIREPWGTINYEGKGVFIAGGAGITPFIAIFRQLTKENKLKGNKLFFSNKTQKDIILEKELRDMFGHKNLIFTLTREKAAGYEKGRINKEFLKNNIDEFNQQFYVCGPPPFVEDIAKALKQLGANTQSVVIEE